MMPIVQHKKLLYLIGMVDVKPLFISILLVLAIFRYFFAILSIILYFDFQANITHFKITYEKSISNLQRFKNLV